MLAGERMTARPVSPVSPAEVVLRGLDAMVVALATVDNDEAVANARSMLEGLDEATLRRVAAYLAHMAVKAMAAGSDAGAVQRRLDHWLLEATAQLPVVRR
jgi:hypothetical protein